MKINKKGEWTRLVVIFRNEVHKRISFNRDANASPVNVAKSNFY